MFRSLNTHTHRKYYTIFHLTIAVSLHYLRKMLKDTTHHTCKIVQLLHQKTPEFI